MVRTSYYKSLLLAGVSAFSINSSVFSVPSNNMFSSHSLYGGFPYGAKIPSSVFRTQARIEALTAYDTFIKKVNELKRRKNSLKESENSDEYKDLTSEIEVQEKMMEEWRRLSKAPTLYDAFFSAFIGPELADAMQGLDFDPSDNLAKALGAGVLLKSAEASGNAIFKDALEKRLGNVIGSGLDKIGNAVTNAFRFCYKKLTGRTGDPFSYEDISISRRSVGDLLNMLMEAGRKAANLGNRDKILRLEDEDEEATDDLWLAMRTLTVAKFKVQVELLSYCLEYYKKDKHSRISIYAGQIRDSLNVLIENVLLPTKSYTYLGEGGCQNALMTLRKSIDSDYESLLCNLPRSTQDGSAVADAAAKRPDPRDRDGMMGVPGGSWFNN